MVGRVRRCSSVATLWLLEHGDCISWSIVVHTVHACSRRGIPGRGTEYLPDDSSMTRLEEPHAIAGSSMPMFPEWSSYGGHSPVHSGVESSSSPRSVCLGLDFTARRV